MDEKERAPFLGRKELFEMLSKIPDAEAKMHSYCEQLMAHSRGAERCKGCWLQNTHCACLSWTSVANRIRVVVHIHHGDWAKASNTGICIHRTLRKSNMFLRGHQEDDTEFRKMLDDPTTMKCVLWPGDGAISVEEFKQLMSKSEPKEVVVIIPDGSYRGARKMAPKYPSSIPRVKLSVESVLGSKDQCMISAVREYGGKQRETGRVSSLEAVAALLDEMGEDPHVSHALKENMKVKLDMVLLQAGRQPLYGSSNGNKESRAY
ncbi:hypothetical protein BSKO_12979 [Bryopsis sp. KO-2023]|nr:hypothetical protein BSKO_12979 [Bryopsis sp. KO-2023]